VSPASTRTLTAPVINCLSIDVEGFVESNRQSFPIAAEHSDASRQDREIERNVAVVLDLLAEHGVRATFFVLGRIARDLPHLVRRIAAGGHEVGSHGQEHLRIVGLAPEVFRDMVARSRADLEQVSGTRVVGFRAPDFSITPASLWALDILRETGFAYDSSIYPFAGHDVYGIPGATPTIHRAPNGLVEFPLATTSLLGRRIPFGGGGYLRLYPLFVTQALIRRQNRRREPCMVYIHPYEVGPEIPVLRELSFYRRFRHYYHSRDGARRIRRVLRSHAFAPAIEILNQGRWLEGPP